MEKAKVSLDYDINLLNPAHHIMCYNCIENVSLSVHMNVLSICALN
jgi:hypothetical protein